MLKEVLDHLPTLAKTYGRWPSYALLLLVLSSQVLLALAVLVR